MAKGQGERRVGVAERRFEVLLENIQEQNRATMEAVLGLRRELHEGLKSLEQRLALRIEALEFAVRKLSEDVKKNSEDIAVLQRRVDELADVLRKKPDEEQLRALEKRVTRLEERLGL